MADWNFQNIHKHIPLIIKECEKLIWEYDEEPPSTCNCGVISGLIADMSGGMRIVGQVYDLEGRQMSDEHAWAVLKDGTIIDASAVQYAMEGRNIGECYREFVGECEGIQRFGSDKYPKHMIAIIPKEHPQAERYRGGYYE